MTAEHLSPTTASTINLATTLAEDITSNGHTKGPDEARGR